MKPTKFQLFMNWITGYWWKPIEYPRSDLYTIYHPVLKHDWNKLYIYKDAKVECDRRNNWTLKEAMENEMR